MGFWGRKRFPHRARKALFPGLYDLSLQLQVKHLQPDMKGGRNKGQTVEHCTLMGSKGGKKKNASCSTVPVCSMGIAWHFCKAHCIVEIQDKHVMLSSHDTAILSGFCLTYRNAGKESILWRLAQQETGWIFLWLLLDYYINYMVVCVCRNQTQ